jgi:hypothetical protein
MAKRRDNWLIVSECGCSRVPLSRARKRIHAGSLNNIGKVMENKITMLHWRIVLQKNAFCIINSHAIENIKIWGNRLINKMAAWVS